MPIWFLLCNYLSELNCLLVFHGAPLASMMELCSFIHPRMKWMQQLMTPW